MKDFFISYTESDLKWASWIASVLTDYGCTTVYQDRDFKPGANFPQEMQKAITETRTTLAIISEKYLEGKFTASEWSAAFVEDPSGENDKLIPIKVEDCQLQGLHKAIVHIDLFQKTESEAIDELLKVVSLAKKLKVKHTSPGNPSVKDKITFPGLKEKSEPHFKAKSSQRFVHTQIDTDGLIKLINIPNPYANLYDPTDAQSLIDISNAFCHLWLPPENYFRVSPLQSLTPAAAICSIDPWNTLNKIKDIIDTQTIQKLKMSPSRMYPDCKEKCIKALSMVLPNCFVAAVTIPDIILGRGHADTNYAYQVLVNLFLKPLMEMHRRIGMNRFNLRISKVNEKKPYLLGLVKSELKKYFPKRDTTSVQFCEENSSDEIFSNISRLIAWVVGVYYNSKDSKWISMLE
ncbi:MAG TPA: toll/interleukin-1 receptor domain-containing protein [Candidatus Kapabacteria bacterium]|nr:toll/interleukin-1 receptor domain-containing protein [Candidatus Kapabacteria bacterium]